MFATIVSVVLTFSPVSVPAAPAASCDACGLTRPAVERTTADRLANAPGFRGVLVAQAELPPPPLPETGGGISGTPGSGASELELRQQIDDLNRQARLIDTNWPIGYIALAAVGYVVGPSGILSGGGGLVFGFMLLAQKLPEAALVLAISSAVLAVGIAGVAAIVFAVIGGSAATEAATKRREELVRQRQQLEQELQLMHSDPRAQLGPPATVTVTLARF